jgi:hypothetical protein
MLYEVDVYQTEISDLIIFIDEGPAVDYGVVFQKIMR